MIRAHVVALKSIALLFALTAAASTAHALPHFGIHRTTVAQQDGRVNLHLYNKSESFRDVKIGDQIYTMQPHASLAIKAPSGTAVVTETTGNLHRKGDTLFAVTPDMQDKTISIN